MLLEENILDDEDDESKKSDPFQSISDLAAQILSSEDESDEYEESDDDDEFEDDEDEDEFEDLEENIQNNENENNKSQTENEQIDEARVEEQELVNKAKELLNKKKFINTTKEEEEQLTFGKFDIIYNNSEKVQDKYTKLIEDQPINSTQYQNNDILINKIKSDIDKYQEERNEIQNFLSHNNKEIKISEARSLIEACLFILGSDGLNAYDLKKVTELPLAIINNILEEMVQYYKKNPNSGLLLVQYGNRYKFVAKSQHYNYISLVLNKKERKPMSESVLETLAIIAYNQPCTKATIEKIRNKSCVNAIDRLKELGLIDADERSESIGKPWLYFVTQKFFDLYGIKSLSELPSINRNDNNYVDQVDENANFINEINEE